MLLVLLLFLVIPIVELYVLVQVAHAIGVGEALLALVLLSVAGAWLVKLQGLATWRRFVTTIRAGGIPHREIVDGALLLLSGALLITPGFVTGALGVLLLIPPVRMVMGNLLLSRFRAGRMLITFSSSPFGRRRSFQHGSVDVDSWEHEPPKGGPGPGELGQ